MSNVPWRIASQSVTVTNKDVEPIFTLEFSVDQSEAHQQRLRIVPYGAGDAVEMLFDTGGLAIGPPVHQPRYLRAFERPDPNLHLDDEEAFKTQIENFTEEQKAEIVGRREALLKRRADYEDARKADEPSASKVDKSKQKVDA